jgi:hypothetical protein
MFLDDVAGYGKHLVQRRELVAADIFSKRKRDIVQTLKFVLDSRVRLKEKDLGLSVVFLHVSRHGIRLEFMQSVYER